MSDETPDQEQPPRRRRRGRFGLWMLLSLAALTLLAGFVALGLTGRPVAAPEWLRAKVEERINRQLPAGQISVAGLSFVVGEGWEPSLQAEDLLLVDPDGLPAARLAEMRMTVAGRALLRGEVVPRRLHLSGAELTLRRAINGEFDLSFLLPGQPMGQTSSAADLLDAIDRAFAAAPLSGIELIEADALMLGFEDARAGQRWQIEDGALRITQDARSVDIGLNVELFYGADTPAGIELSFASPKGSAAAQLGARFSNVAARDLASQAPVLAWMGALDAPISGAMRTDLAADGSLGDVNATLEIGAGALRPNDSTKPVAFTAGRAYFRYDPGAAKMTFDELSVETAAGVLRAEGQGYLRDLSADGWPQTMLGQFRLSEVQANPEGIFEEAVSFSGGAADLRLRFDPFTLTIGQAVLFEEARRYHISGEVRGEADGWALELDGAVDAIDHERILALWPVVAAPKTRLWLRENLLTGQVTDIRGALRLRPGQELRSAVTYEFHDADVRFVGTLPPITGGRGYASLQGKTYTMSLDAGTLTPPRGGQIDATGSVFAISDITLNPAVGDIQLKARAPLQATLSLLDEKPFEFLTKAGLPVDLATGRAEVEAEISLPLIKKVPIEQVDYGVVARLRDIRSEQLVKGRVLSAAALAVRVDEEGMEISGPARLDGVPVQGSWVQKFGPEHKGRSRVEGTVELSQRFVDTFGIGLPKGSVSGEGSGRVELDLQQGAPPRFSLLSDLNRVGLRLADLGWSKPRNATGRLAVSGRLSSPASIESLEIDAAGLRASGQVSLKPDGTLDEARFARVRLDDWLDASVLLSGRGQGASPAVALTGGTLDIRKTSLASGGGGGGRSGAPMNVTLDRVILSEGIVLTALRGRFSQRPGLNGSFTAGVNGQAAVQGTLAPASTGGTAIRIRADDAGAVFRAIGLIEGARLGTMDLVMSPRPGAPGQYNGRLTGAGVRIRGAPALADLLSAISVVGLLEQFNGQGIYFGDYEADFRLTPNVVAITRSSAVGPSLGLSMDGVYGLQSKRMDMQGVISPIYVVNGIGQMFTRKGEGLFGFNFTLKGPAASPSVQVNPLSIFTPGMFREIFRRPPPKVSQ